MICSPGEFACLFGTRCNHRSAVAQYRVQRCVSTVEQSRSEDLWWPGRDLERVPRRPFDDVNEKGTIGETGVCTAINHKEERRETYPCMRD